MLSSIVHAPSARAPAYPRDLRLPRLAAIFVTTGVLLLAQYVQAQEPIVGHWDFRDVAGGVVKDRSPSGNDGRLLNGAQIVTDGQDGAAVELNGRDQSVEIPVAKAILAAGQSRSIEVWFKPDSLAERHGTLVALNQTAQHPSPQHCIATIMPNSDGLVLFSDGVNQANNRIVPPGKLDLADLIDRWNHYVLTFDDKEQSVRIYVNGAQVSAGTCPVKFTAGAGAVRLGASDHHAVYAGHFDGLIDEVQVYAAMLSEEEVRQRFESGKENYGKKGISLEKPPFHHATIESEEARYALGIAPVAEKGQGYPGVWVGRFIWDQGESAPRHYHLMARKTFTLQETPQRATLKISVCDRYRLYVNGAYVGRGAARISRPQWTPYDTYNIARLLGPGRNVIAVLAHHYGCPNNYTADLRSGIFAQLQTASPGGTEQIVATDGSWRVLPMQGYRRDTPVLNDWHGIADEILDAAKDPADWMQPEFDDSAWPGARVLAADLNPMRWTNTDDSPWQCLEPRRVPMLRERRVVPARVVKVAEAIETPLDLEKESSVFERLTSEKHAALEHAKAENVEALVRGAGPARLSGVPAAEGREARSPLIILDFGRPLFGCPELTLTAPAGALIDLIYGNRVHGEGVAARVVPGSPLHVGDRLIARAGRQTWQLSDTRQFRYLQIVVRRAAEPVLLEKAEMVSIEYPLAARGKFECSEPVLNRVWQAGVDTVFLHMEDTHVCDATRERRQYCALQELRGGLRGIYAGFGDRFIAEETLLTTKRMQLPDGQIEKYSGSNAHWTGIGRVAYAVNGFSTLQFPNQDFGYALAVWDHFLWFGEKSLLAAHYPALERLREFYEQYAVYERLIYSLPSMNFMDWAPHELRGANQWVNAGYAEMLDAMSRMAVELGKPPAESETLTARAAEIRATLRKLHWNEERALFTDSVVAGRQSPSYSEMTNAYAILFGIADQRHRQRIVQRVFDPKDGMTRPTPLDIGFIAQGLIAAGAVDDTLRMLARKFGPMVAESDVPTIAEGWVDQAYSGAGKGAIHDSACGIMMTFLESILGVAPAEPGFARCRIEPHLGSLPWAKGVVPTPRGDVRVSWRRSEKGRLTFEIETPAGMPVELVLPRPTGAAALVLDGRQVVTGGKPAEADVRVDAGFIRVTLLSGAHQGELSSGDAK